MENTKGIDIFFFIPGSTDNDIDSEPEEEHWDENEEIVNDIPEDSEPDSEPGSDDITVEYVSHQSSALAQWLALFLLRIKSMHRLSDTDVMLVQISLGIFLRAWSIFFSLCRNSESLSFITL